MAAHRFLPPSSGRWRFLVVALLNSSDPSARDSSSLRRGLKLFNSSPLALLIVFSVYFVVGTVATIQFLRVSKWTTRKVVHLIAFAGCLSRCLCLASLRPVLFDSIATLCQLLVVVSVASFWARLRGLRWVPGSATALASLAGRAPAFLASSLCLVYYGHSQVVEFPRIRDLKNMSSIVSAASSLRAISLALKKSNLLVDLFLELVPVATVLYYYRHLPLSATPQHSSSGEEASLLSLVETPPVITTAIPLTPQKCKPIDAREDEDSDDQDQEVEEV